MDNKNTIFDESIYPISWRFNSDDCLLSNIEKSKIIFLCKKESMALWEMLFNFNHIMHITSDFNLIKKEILDFEDDLKSKKIFEKYLEHDSLNFFFWGKSNCAIVPSFILIKAWSDFFYPSDDNCIAYLLQGNKVIFSHEETLFYGEIK